MVTLDSGAVVKTPLSQATAMRGVSRVMFAVSAVVSCIPTSCCAFVNISPASNKWRRNHHRTVPLQRGSFAFLERKILELKMAPIGFVGLGVMGEGMAARLLSEGVAGSEESPLIIWNRTKSKCIELQGKFPDKAVVVKDTAREVIESSQIIYSMLSTPEVSRIVFEGPDGVLAGVSAGKSIADCATLAEEDMKRMSNAVTSKGGRFLEAPVSGSKIPAATGALVFLCAGSQDLFDEVKDTGLKVMGKASHFFNTQVGYGTRAKLVVNSLMGTMLAAFSESLALSESVGLDKSKMIEVIGQGSIQSPLYALKGPKMIADDFDPNFALRHAVKDMTLASELANKAGVEFSIIHQAEELYRAACEDNELGVADDDFSAIYKKVQKDSKK